jgi:phage-related protein
LEGRVARVLFTVVSSVMVLLHGFIKKSAATPKDDLALAKSRLKQLRSQ